MRKNPRARGVAAVLAVLVTALALLVAAPVVGSAAPASAATTAGVSTSTPVIEAGTPITVDFDAPSNQVSATNWIGFYYNQTPGASCPSPSTYWQYTSTGGTAEPAAGTAAPASGSLTFPTTGWKAGSYAVYLCYNDGYTKVGTAITVTVLPAPDVLNTDFVSGAPIDHAQGLTATTYGTPSIAKATDLGQDVATFNGSTDAYQYDFTSQYSKLAKSLTVDCEFKWNGAALSTLSASAYPSICSGEQSGGVNIEVYNDKLNASIDVGGYKYAYAAADAVQPGTWYDAVATWDGSTLSLYLNGTLVATTAASGTLTLPAAASEKWTLGADVSGSGGIEAEAPVSLAHARIWSTALSAAQVGDLYGLSVNGIAVTTSGQGTASATPAQASAGASVALSETPATGYRFAGWQVTRPSDGSVTIASDGTFTMPAEPVAVTADFVADGYTVHFDGNGATGGTMPDEAFSYDQAAALTANAFTDPGEQFEGWATSADGNPVYQDGQQVSELSATDGAVVTLYAVWIPTGDHVVEVASAGHGIASAPTLGAATGSTVKLTATPDTGYHLTGWKVTSPADGSLTIPISGVFTMPAANVAVEARFTANTYTVTFDGNGATVGTMPSITLSYDTPTSLPAVGFIRDGYMLTGWATSAKGPVAYAPGASVENVTATENATVTLYAVWAVQQSSVGTWPSLQLGFVTDTFKLPAVPERGRVDQQLLGLWNGAKPTMFTKVSGDAWLSIDAFGVVTGTAPGTAENPATITVTATNGTTTSTILVEVPVTSRGAAPQVKAATWNAWNDGANVTDAVGKNLAVIAARGIDEIGFQSGGAQMAAQVASALGWNVRFAGDLGIVSAYPFTSAPEVLPTSASPVVGATVDVAGQPVQLWDAYLSETSAATRDAQAAAVAREIARDASPSAPAILLGDLASSSEASVFTRAGLTDSYRTANRSTTADPGATLLFASPSDRVDYVDYTPSRSLGLVDSDTLSLGWPSATAPAGNSWASDHRAVVTTFAIG